MNRSEVIAKIQAMMKLKEGTTFEGEASAAASMIDKLCSKYNVSVSDTVKVQVLHEPFLQKNRFNQVLWKIFTSVARFYDAQAMINCDTNTFSLIGSEAQHIVVKIYYDYIVECMEAECNKAHKGELLLCKLMDKPAPPKNFKFNFRVAFAQEVGVRLHNMKKEEQRVHEHAKDTSLVVNSMKLGTFRRKPSRASGDGALSGYSAGSNVSLRKQATGGGGMRQLSGV
jgi:enamine deaminase RidA (YjgF/YER057c/UK114 family)